MAKSLDPQITITPFGGDNVETAQLRIHNLYLHHLFSGANRNQENIVSRCDAGNSGFGTTTVNNWTIFDGDSVDATLVARAQGLHILAGTWHNSFTMVFEAGRLKGSTLQVMGSSVENNGSWAIVGGTGDLSMARGVIKRRLHRSIDGGHILQLAINAFCTLEKFPAIDMSVQWGATEHGSVHKNIIKPWRLESITIRAEHIVDSFQFSYVDQDGVRRTEEQWGEGGGPGSTNTVSLGPKEFVRELSGTYTMNSPFTNQVVLTSLKLITNFRSYGPFGTGDGTPFNADIPRNSFIVGFHGRSEKFVNAIGVYTMQL